MKKIIAGILVLSTLVFAGMGEPKGDAQGNNQMEMFQSVDMNKVTIMQGGKAKMFCPACGMNLPMFYKTNHAANNGEHVEQYCSLHCLVETNMKNKGILKDIIVVDVTTLEFIDARTASYVVGSSKKGTMSMVSKYAFAKKEDAQDFAKKFGGKVENFDETYKIASNSMEKEMKMIAEKQAMMAQKGEMMYNKMCKKTDLKFKSTAEAKAYIQSNKLCGDMSGKKLQAVGIYLGRR
ncbi:hypothetical protein SMGD1_0038 [Sulfurimonas gotlandica GD1]|jgi:copper chaperone NosL|uniref:NosL family protein n=1 Tax=Sulfurimonas gotlandica (strain DSM 19862 / JCM 16533 / GD1) TaxID=929558 RepID=B6BLB1_SULGG|nr:nitrous oxide reductase accessory protein NosL [Sulfurimonas gotlandica]EDZ62059.1 conserved hypothetical protein [Sulfurimonas gotlandica GD1]EHP28565.1 hypothetical protein SMGD1_0038 [Sulfurimonas gotlandica GD1]